MTTVNFSPSSNANFTFQATLDEEIYTVVITWNFAGQRYYFNIYDLSGTLVLSSALIGSPPDYPINLLAIGYFQTSTMVFYQQAQTFVISP